MSDLWVSLSIDAQHLWLSHHRDDQLDRCAVVAGRHVCRRCLVLYPIALLSMAAVLAGVAAPSWLLFVLPAAAAIEFVVEQLGLIRYHPARQSVLTAIAAPALGIGFGRVVENPADRPFWTMVAMFAVPCAIVAVVVAAVVTARTQRCSSAALEGRRFESDQRLTTGFSSAEEFRQYLDAAELVYRSATTAKSHTASETYAQNETTPVSSR